MCWVRSVLVLPFATVILTDLCRLCYNRYEALVAELDLMVEEGYYIPSDLSAKDKDKDAKNAGKSSVTKKKQQAGAGGGGGGSKVVGSSTKSTASAAGHSGSKGGGKGVHGHASKLNASSSLLDGGGSLDGGSSIEEDTGNGGTNHSGSITLSVATPAAPYYNPEGKRFAQRQSEEDEAIDAQVQDSRVLRHGESMGAEATRLVKRIAELTTKHNDEKHVAALAREALEQETRVLHKEVHGLTQKVNKDLSVFMCLHRSNLFVPFSFSFFSLVEFISFSLFFTSKCFIL
jgi:hypothetical protein